MHTHDGTSARPTLSPERQALMEKWLRGEARRPGPQPISRRARGETVPLSYAQERLFFMDRLDPGSYVYNLPMAWRLTGPLDRDVLERVLSEIVRRHEAVRTVFRLQDGRPVQAFLPPFRLEIPVEDVPPLPRLEREEALRARVRAEAQKPFDLERGPLVRAALFRLAPEDHALVLTLHHIVCDGWSFGVYFRELRELYGAFEAGLPSPLPELPVQYADYSEWQREYLAGPVSARQLEFWKRHLEGAPALELPTDRPRPPVQSFRGAIHRFVLPAGLSDRLRRLAQRESVTLSMLLMAAFEVLLHRYSGQDDVVIGILAGNRNRAEIEPLIGFFINTLPVRTDLRGDPGFLELLRRVRTANVDANDNQDLPFGRILEAMGAARDLSRNPLVQVLFFLHTFVVQNAPPPTDTVRRLAIDTLEGENDIILVDTGTAKFDLTLGVVDLGAHLSAGFEYAADLFDEATVARMVEQFRVLLEEVAADPERPIGSLPLERAEERAAILARGRGAGTAPAAPATLHGRFAERAGLAPDAVAVACGDARLTYGELDAASDRAARRLRALGVGPESRVGVCLERGVELVVAILAVLKAGGAYVPLDPSYPEERLRFLTGDSGIRVLLTRGGLRGALPGYAGETVCLDEPEDGGAEPPPAVDPLPDSLAYLIYTSGSTGTPKGVEVTHAAVLRLFAATDPWFGFGEGDAWTLFHSYAFDFSVWEMWGALLYGGRLVVVPWETSRDPEAFRGLLARERVTVLSQTPSAFRQLARADEAAPADDLALRWVVFGGEALDPASLRPWTDRHGDRRPRLVNMYGITETTVHVTFRPVSRADVEAGRQSPIGVPIPDLDLYLLDTRGEPVPEGVPGELYVGGAGLARGYRGRPALTAERFVPDPFGAAPGARLYRSGDRARWSAAGELEYLGRTDEQVKVRGFRVEPGEIEAALRAQPGVADAAVVVREDAPGDRRLVAYVAGAADPAGVRAALRRTLPDHMVPAAVVALEALPLTAHGKLDRGALPAPEAGGGAGAEPPAPGAEAALAEIWREVLRVESVGAHDNFFELGGDSILMLQVVARANQAGLRLSARQMFQAQTVAQAAALAGTAAATHAEQGPVAGETPLTPVQRWLLEREPEEPDHWNMSFALEAREPVELETLREAVARLALHHDALRSRFERTDSGWRQAVAAPGETTEAVVERVDVSALPEAEREAAVVRAAAALQRGMELRAGPLLRAALCEFGPGRPQRILLVAHHLVVDWVSWRLLAEDLEAAYGQLARGEAVRLPPKTTSFRHWAGRLAEHARSPALRAEAPFWAAARAAPAARLPRDGDGGPGDEGSVRALAVALEAEETRLLLHHVPAVYGTQVNEVLLAALARAHARWTGGSALVVDLEGHGREALFDDVDLSRTVGWFTTVFPVRLETGRAAGPGETLKAVKEQLRSIPGRGIGYGVLRYLGDDDVAAPLRSQPDAEISFNYLGHFDGAPSTPGRFRPVEQDAGPPRAPGGRRRHLLEVVGAVVGDRLELTWVYGEGAHSRATVERFARDYLDELRALVAHCMSPGAGGFTPSDFPEAELSQDELDALLGELGGEAR
ncbi:MAG TPA: amino acid adenylation domain-containing protein [Longimicrobiaceae bacterium]|jgi:amino acid adenylation domain-containing protein/non-ribosomal peptide synthase protein (TIGR01720 family)